MDAEQASDRLMAQQFAGVRVREAIWNPMRDITTIELAHAMPVLIALALRPFGFDPVAAVEALMPEARRHFRLHF
jgi:hypothetical protein